MGIRFSCPKGHKLNVKLELAGKRAICPECGARMQIPDLQELSIDGPPPIANVASSGKSPADATWPAITDSTSSVTIALETAVPPVTNEPSPPLSPLPLAAQPPARKEPALDLPTSVVPARPPVVSALEPPSLEDQYQLRRERRRRNQAIFAVVLMFMVVALGVTLVWVLWRNANSNANPTPTEQNPPAKTGAVVMPRSVFLANTSAVLYGRARSESL